MLKHPLAGYQLALGASQWERVGKERLTLIHLWHDRGAYHVRAYDFLGAKRLENASFPTWAEAQETYRAWLIRFH